MPLSAYGVDLTPPSPVKYTVPTNPGDIKSVMTSVNKAQNDANAANNQRYTQQLGVLTNGTDIAKNDLTSGYNAAVGDLGNSLANNTTVFNNAQSRAISDAVKNSSAAQQNGISRGLGNTTIMNSMQDQVQRAKDDALAQIASDKATQDNAVYKNISDIHQNQGTATSNLGMQGTSNLANAIGNRNDVGPSLSDYSNLAAQAAQAQNSSGRTTITTTDPIPINSPLRTGGGAGGGAGGIAASMGSYGSGGGGGGNHESVPGSGGVFGGYPSATTSPAASPSAPSATPQMSPVSVAPQDAGKTVDTGPNDASAIMPDKPGGQGVYDMQNNLIGIRYPDGTFKSMNLGTA